jgi:S-phase kinase-associated protein 1
MADPTAVADPTPVPVEDAPAVQEEGIVEGYDKDGYPIKKPRVVHTLEEIVTDEETGKPYRMYKVQTQDNDIYTLPEPIIAMCKMLKKAFDDTEDEDDDEPLSLPTISSKVFDVVVKYCVEHFFFVEDPIDVEIRELNEKYGGPDYPNMHDGTRIKDPKVVEIDSELMDEIKAKEDGVFLQEVMVASDFLELRELLKLCGFYLALGLRDKNHLEMREYLGIEGDFTPEEEEENRKLTAWQG